MTTANDRDRVAAIEARVNAATVGRWEWNEGLYPNRMDSLLAVDPDDDNEVEDVIYTTVAGILIKDEDAALIANAPADIRYLLARVRETEAALQEIADFKAVRVPGTGVTLYVTAFDRVQEIAAAALGKREDGER